MLKYDIGDDVLSKRSSSRLTLALFVMALSLCGCMQESVPPVTSTPPVLPEQSEAPPNATRDTSDTSESAATGEVVITFEYEKQSGYASNQLAVWVEDADGNFVKTLYATRFTAVGGYKNRPDSIPAWVEKSGLSSMSETEIDAITGATPKTGTLSYTWDLTDTNGDMVPSGKYKFFVEGSLRWKNRILYSGMFEAGDIPSTVQADAEFFYEANDNQPALSENSTETMMIGAVTASFTPGNL